MRLTAEEWEVAGRVCTPRQLEALDLWRRGFGYRRIAAVLDVDVSVARRLVGRGKARVVAELELAAVREEVREIWLYRGL